MSAEFACQMARAFIIGLGFRFVESHAWITTGCVIVAFILTDYLAEREAREQVIDGFNRLNGALRGVR